jgi:hypothetical protein
MKKTWFVIRGSWSVALLLLTGCSVTFANRSNVTSQTILNGPSEAAIAQDSQPTGGATLKLPLESDGVGTR